MKPLKEYLKDLHPDLIAELELYASIEQFVAHTEILREGQYVKMVPLVLEGSIKVFTRNAERELLLYYIESGESCIMSFNAGLKNGPSKVAAVVEENAILLLMPTDKLNRWLKEYPSFNQLFYRLYDQRYESLIETINQILYNRLDHRLMDFLLERSRQKNTRIVALRHREMAAALGTVREVISRTLKKLENDGKIRQVPAGIEIL